MSIHKVIIVNKNLSYFEQLHEYLLAYNVGYQKYDTFSSYLTDHDYCNHVLIANAHDILDIYKSHEIHTYQFNRQLFKCTYIIVYDENNSHDHIKESLIVGADDYLLLPFNPDLTSLKIIAQYNRLDFLESLYLNEQNSIVYKHMTIDTFSKQVTLKKPSFNAYEFRIQHFAYPC